VARILALTLVGALLGGCATGQFNATLDAGVVTKGTGEVVMGVMAELTHGRVVQAVVSAYTAADVNRFSVDLHKQQADSSYSLVASQTTPEGSGVAKTVNFGNLKEPIRQSMPIARPEACSRPTDLVAMLRWAADTVPRP